MNFAARYTTTRTEAGYGGQPRQVTEPNVFAIVRDIVIAILAPVTFLIAWPFYSVPTGSRGVITQFGAIKGIEAEGLAVLPPWQKLSLFSIRAEQADIDKAEGSTSDTQPVSVSMTVRYSIVTDRVSEVFEKYSHNGDLSSYVQTAAQEIFKAVTAKYTAPDLISKRPQVSNDIYAAVGKKLAIYGAQVINIDMRNFSFSASYMEAINEKVTQEQKRLAALNKLQTVEAEQKQKVAVAEADASAVRATADGNAYATVANAKADAQSTILAGEAKAKAMQVQAEALAKNVALVELKKAEKWDGKLPQAIYAGAPIPFMSVK